MKRRRSQAVFLSWRVILSHAAAWVRVIEKPYSDDEWRLLQEFYDDDNPVDLAYEKMEALVARANTLARAYPIPGVHWVAAKEWRTALDPYVEIVRDGRATSLIP